jgi:hypothetical protein
MTSEAENEPERAIPGFEHGTDPKGADGIPSELAAVPVNQITKGPDPETTIPRRE